MATIDLPCTHVMIANGITHGPIAAGEFGEPLGGWPVGSIELDSGYLSTGPTALSTPYVGPVWAVYDEVGFVFFDVHDSTLINPGVDDAPGDVPASFAYWAPDRSYDVEFDANEAALPATSVELVAHIAVTGGGSQRFWLTYVDDASVVRWAYITPTIEAGGADEQVREFTVALPGLSGDAIAGGGFSAVFAQTGGGTTCRITYLALRVEVGEPVLRLTPRDNAEGSGGTQRVYPEPRRGRVFGNQP